MSVPFLARTPVVAALYAALSVAFTWPVARGIARDLPGDLGDPAFVTGVLAWGADHWLSLLSGDFGAASRFWNAPFFHPEPLATAYSEHFLLHSLLTLPVYIVSRNPILCYNVAFLSSFTLCGLGMYLLVRDLLGERRRFSLPAFVAGMIFAFALYRVATLPHLHVLSSQWMPFVLLSLRRYFDGSGQAQAHALDARDRHATMEGVGLSHAAEALNSSRNSDALMAAGLAWWAQNLASGYYMLYFTPFVALYALSEIWARRLWTRLHVWRDLVLTAVVVGAATLPFAMPYLERARGTRRSMIEVVAYSADLEGWLTASPLLHVWGGLQTFVKAEGYLFPGVTALLLAAVGVWRGRRLAAARGAWIFAMLAVLIAFWLSLGPEIQRATQPLAFPSLYRPLWELVPGFQTARVPARFATIVVLGLAVLAGVGGSVLNAGGRRWLLAICALLVMSEGFAAPLPVNNVWTTQPQLLRPPPPRLYPLAEAPDVYRFLASLENNAVVAHFPFGPPEREIQYGYYAMLHGQRTVNGYSGAFPPSYRFRTDVLTQPLRDVAAVKMMLDLDGVTHCVVMGSAYLGEGAELLIAALEGIGWRRAIRFGDDQVLVR